MSVKLITGLKTTADIESQDDGARIYGTISNKDRVLEISGNLWGPQIISNNCIRIKSGEALIQGRHVRQAPNTYTDLTINNGEQGKKRYDIIVLRYTKAIGTGIENVELAVVEGTPTTSSTPTVPSLTTGNIFTGCTIHEMALYRVLIDGLTIYPTLTRLYTTIGTLDDHFHQAIDIIGGVTFNNIIEQKIYFSDQPMVNASNTTTIYLTNPFQGNTTNKILGITSSKLFGRRSREATGDSYAVLLVSGNTINRTDNSFPILLRNTLMYDLYLTTESYIVVSYIRPTY